MTAHRWRSPRQLACRRRLAVDELVSGNRLPGRSSRRRYNRPPARAYSSAWSERLPYKQEVGGSSPSAPTRLATTIARLSAERTPRPRQHQGSQARRSRTLRRRYRSPLWMSTGDTGGAGHGRTSRRGPSGWWGRHNEPADRGSARSCPRRTPAPGFDFDIWSPAAAAAFVHVASGGPRGRCSTFA